MAYGGTRPYKLYVWFSETATRQGTISYKTKNALKKAFDALSSTDQLYADAWFENQGHKLISYSKEGTRKVDWGDNGLEESA